MTSTCILQVVFLALRHAFPISDVSLCSGVSKGPSDHLYMASFIDTNVLTAQTLYPSFFQVELILSRNPILMASQNFSRANLIVFPQLSLTGSTFDHQHNKLPHAKGLLAVSYVPCVICFRRCAFCLDPKLAFSCSPPYSI